MKKILASLTILSVLIMVAPSTAYAVATTWNSADKNANITLSNGDLTATASASGQQGVRATTGKATGKWYWEITITNDGNSGDFDDAVANTSASLSANARDTANAWSYYANNGNKSNNSYTAYGAAITTNDVLGVAINMDTGKIWWAKNGTWQASGDPAAGTGEAFANLTGTLYPFFVSNGGTSAVTANFGATATTYTPPTGFSTFDSPPAAVVPSFGDIILFGDW